MNEPPVTVTELDALVIVTAAVLELPVWLASPAYVPVAVQEEPSATETGAEEQLPLYVIVTVAGTVN